MSYSEPGSRDPIDCAFKISAIVPTHNRARYIAEALDSLLGQQTPLHELIVIDDASTDETSDVLAGYRDQARIIELTANSGKAAALNMAIPLATGDYIWLFDDDDVALPDALSRHIELLTERDDVDFTYSDTYHTQDSDNIWNRDAWRLNEPPDMKPERFLLETMLSMNTPIPGMLIRRDALLHIGLFDKGLHRCQDLDLLVRLGAAGYRGAKVNAPTFVYREHAGPRGGGRHTYTTDQLFRVQHEYRKQVFHKAKKNLRLDHYLIHVDDGSVLSSDAAREPAARLQRGCVMLRQGLVSDGLADLEAALGHPTIAHVDTAWIADNLTLALDVEPWMFEEPRSVALRLPRLLSRHTHHNDYAKASARGLYWSLRREFELRRSRQALSAGLLLSGFLVGCVGQQVKNVVFNN